MTSTDDNAGPTPASTSRRGFLARLGAFVVGAAAAGILLDQQAALASPVCCGNRYPGCLEVGISCSPPGVVCCWMCTTDNPCRTYKCCDKTLFDTTCTCAVLVSSQFC